jgi:hypothetical protein
MEFCTALANVLGSMLLSQPVDEIQSSQSVEVHGPTALVQVHF